MLQNPSKYHPNPLSHFLALHNSQAAHNARNNSNSSTSNNNNNTTSHILTNVSAFGLGGGHNQFQQNHQQQQHQQQPQHTHSLLTSEQQQQQQQLQQSFTHSHNLNATTHAHQHAQFLDATGTTLDVGKSFTIAAILGLQSRNGIDHSQRKDYNNVINLSLSGNSNSNGTQSKFHQRCSTPPTCNDEVSKDPDESPTVTVAAAATTNNNRESNPNDSNISIKSELAMSVGSKFHCDSNAGVVNHYLHAPATAASNGTTSAFIASAAQHQHHAHQQHQQNHHHHTLMTSHVRANSFAAAAAVAAVAAANVNAVVNGGPTALQSLQQLHQHHAQQSSLSFTREKLKAENHSKKTSLKNKRVRTIFTPEQLERLEAEFERQQYMVGPERLYLAHTLQLTEAQVKVWFQNRRIKWRKHHLELTQQRLALLRQNQLSTPNAGNSIGLLPSPDGLATAASNSSFEENDEPKEDERKINNRRSHTESESELSVCNDSMDADSINDGGGDT